MRTIMIPTAFAVATAAMVAISTPAPAKGCLKGAVIGGVAGHYLGHHGWLGAGAGCIIGHHEAAKRAREQQRGYEEGYGSSAPHWDRGYGPPP
jgi:hypothetical protein